jgi:RNA polymerase sigma-B factor
MRFAEELTQSEIGERLGVSQMQISRISRAALWKLLAAVRGETAEGGAPPTSQRKPRET